MVVTEWNEFRALDLDALKRSHSRNVLVGLPNIYLPAQLRAAGFSYTCVGQGTSSKPAEGVPRLLTLGLET